MKFHLKCETCGKAFQATRQDARNCDASCRSAALRGRLRAAVARLTEENAALRAELAEARNADR